MKFRLFILAIAATISSVASATNRCTKLFMYGFAMSLNDSTVYFTDIQEVDSAWTDTKTDFLYSRDNYSYQLRDHLKKEGIAHTTCVTMYAKTRKDIEKKYFAFKKRYTTKGKYDIKYIASTDFKFYPIIPNEEEMYGAAIQENTKKAPKDKKAKKTEKTGKDDK